MIIDLSQTAVNRTAMYTISRDVLDALKDRPLRRQYFGQVLTQEPGKEQLRILKRTAFEQLFADPGQLAGVREAPIPRNERSRRLYLDPLYALFGGLSEDDILFVLDLSPVTTPHWHSAPVARAYRTAFELVCKRRPTVVAISQNTADTFYANYAYPPERTHVLRLYVPQHLTEALETLPFFSPEPYVLFVGSLEKRKNIVGAIESFGLSDLANEGYRLIVAGGAGHGSDEIRERASQADNVFMTGYVSDRELRGLYQSASVFLYPSYLEGFGVPLLEAMNAGIPAVASLTGACPEVGGDLVRYFDPDDHLSFANELRRLVGFTPTEREAYAQKARQRVQETFCIEHFKSGLKEILDRR